MKKILAYIPVLHAGYLEFLEKNTKNTDEFYLIDPKWAQTLDPQLDYLRKEIRSLSPSQIKNILLSLYPKLKVNILNKKTLQELLKEKDLKLIAPDEDISHVVIEKFFPKIKSQYSPIFLRWDKKRANDTTPVRTDEQISRHQFDQRIIKQTFKLAGLSSDWWRHVGAVLIKNEKVILQNHNFHTPSPQTQYINGDVRSLAKSGEKIEISTSQHAEAAILAEAAKLGIKTEGLDLYVTTFPCPYCARLIAQSGIKRLYFAEGYSVLDGQEELKREQVKIIRVIIDDKIRKLKNKNSLTKKYK